MTDVQKYLQSGKKHSVTVADILKTSIWCKIFLDVKTLIIFYE